jgi:predicted transcriptional regulator
MARLLGVTRQRVHQLLVRHLAAGTIRLADERNPSLMIARSDDPVMLLRQEMERVLSALPDPGAATVTAQQISSVVHLPPELVGSILEELAGGGLIARAGSGTMTTYQLTAAGTAHCQRRSDARRVAPPEARIPFRSERIQAVLDHMARHGPARAITLSQELDISFQSMNALMQYLKRRGLASKADVARSAPHQITEAGRRVLQAFQQRA